MPEKIITVRFGPSEIATVNFDGVDTTYSLELREISLNGVQGTDVGKAFSIHFRDNGGGSGFITESFQQIRNTGSVVGSNIGERSATGSKDIPFFIEASPYVHIEYNFPHILINNQGVPSTKYAFVPSLVFAEDGTTQPIFSSCILKFCLKYGPNNQGSNNWPTIKYAFRNG